MELYRFEPQATDGLSTSSELDEAERFLERPTNRCDITSERGLTHFRAALLEDRSYLWPAQPLKPSDQWRWILVFRHEKYGPRAILIFSPDWQFVTTHRFRERRVGVGPFTKFEIYEGSKLSCKPIAAGLDELLGNLTADRVER